MNPEDAIDIYLLKHNMVNITIGFDGFAVITYFPNHPDSVRMVNHLPERVDEQLVF
jgi:hypothetical protein